MKLRLLNKICAHLLGYFWLPCPSCGKMFGGHEVIGFKMIIKDDYGYCCCPDCENNPNVIDEGSTAITWLNSKLKEMPNDPST